MTNYSKPLLIVLAVGMTSLFLVATALRTPEPLSLTLKEAMSRDLLEATIRGRSSDYDQPLAVMGLRNLTDQPISIELPKGSILRSEQGQACDLVFLRSEPPQIFLHVGSNNNDASVLHYDLFSFCLDLAGEGQRHTFPSVEATYEPTDEFVSQELQRLLEKLETEGPNFAAQVAVWKTAGLNLGQWLVPMEINSLGERVLVKDFKADFATSSLLATTTQHLNPTPTQEPTNPIASQPAWLATGMVVILLGIIGLFTIIPHRMQYSLSSSEVNKTRELPAKMAHSKNRRTTKLASGWGVRGAMCDLAERAPRMVKNLLTYIRPRPTSQEQTSAPPNFSERQISRHERVIDPQTERRLQSAAADQHTPLAPVLTGSDLGDAEALTLELKVIQGQQTGPSYTFTGGPSGLQGIISRGRPKQIALSNDPKVSMPHAMLDISYRYGQENRIRDLGSKNGTWLNGLKLRPRTWNKLKDGDLLRFGDTELRYHQATQQLTYETHSKPAIRMIGTNRWLISRHEIVDFFDLESNDTTISVPHVYIRLYHNGLLEVRDVSSGNGVRLQGRQINGKESIFNGDMIQLGRHTEIQVVTNISGIPDKINNKWQRISLIARGGMADVYRARDLHSGQIRALKIPHPNKYRLTNDWGVKYRTLFLTECQLTEKTYHANLIRAFESHEMAGSGLPYLVLEYIDGPSIHAIIKKVGLFSVADAAEVAYQVCCALKNLHFQQRYVHCDIKPSNILIDKQGQVHLIDLGIATPIGQPFSNFGVSKYLPKEVLTHAPVYPDTDIYSLGQTLFEMLAGRSLSGAHLLQNQSGIKTSTGTGTRTGTGTGTGTGTRMKQTAPIAPDRFNGPATLLRRNVRSPQMQKTIAKCINDKRDYRYQDIDRLISDLSPLRAGADLAALVHQSGWRVLSSQL